MFEQPSATPNHQPNQERHEDEPSLLKDVVSFGSNFRDLFSNMYKYADQVELAGNMNVEPQVLFERIDRSNTTIEWILDISGALRENGGNVDGSINQKMAAAVDSSECWSSVSGLDSEALVAGFNWALRSWDVLGSRFGRPMTISPSKIPRLVDDLRIRISELKRAGLV